MPHFLKRSCALIGTVALFCLFSAQTFTPKTTVFQKTTIFPHIVPAVNCASCTVLQSVTSSGSGTSHPESFTGSVTNGSLLVIFTSHNSWSGSGTSTATDVNGNTYHPCSGTGTGSFTDVHILSTYGMGCLWAINSGTGTDTITLIPTDCAVTCSDVGNLMYEISGASTTPSVAWDAWGNTTVVNSTSGSNNMLCAGTAALTTTQANDIIICAVNAASGTASGGSTPLNFGTLDQPGSANAAGEHAVWTNTGTLAATMTNNTSGVAYGAITLAFK